MATRNQSFLSYKTFTIKANSVTPHNVTGQVFICKESSDKFFMRIDDSEKIPMELGLGFRLDGKDEFKKLTFINETASDITVEYYSGVGEIRDARLNTLLTRTINVTLKAFPTAISATAAICPTTIAGGASLTMSGIIGGLHRKQIVITNLDTASDLNILNGLLTVVAVVMPRSVWTMETDADFIIQNATGSAMSIAVMHTFYTS